MRSRMFRLTSMRSTIFVWLCKLKLFPQYLCEFDSCFSKVKVTNVHSVLRGACLRRRQLFWESHRWIGPWFWLLKSNCSFVSNDSNLPVAPRKSGGHPAPLRPQSCLTSDSVTVTVALPSGEQRFFFGGQPPVVGGRVHCDTLCVGPHFYRESENVPCFSYHCKWSLFLGVLGGAIVHLGCFWFWATFRLMIFK